ncbi:MAG: dTMP kinase [Nanoarchaeota archaeon]
MTSGKFISVEGIDGCGKSTQFLLIAKYILEKFKGNDIYLGVEPTRYFREIRNKLQIIKNVNDEADWFVKAFVEDRKHHVEKIIKLNLQNGTHVLVDRYDLSSYAYQQAQGIQLEKIKQLHEGILIPDLTIIYYCDPQIAFRRRLRAGVTSLFDTNLEFQKLVQKFFLDLPKIFPERQIVLVDTDKGDHVQEAVKLVFAETKRYLEKLF